MRAQHSVPAATALRHPDAGMPAYLSEAYFTDLLAEAEGRRPRIGTARICDHWMGPLPALRHRGGSGLAILFDRRDALAPSDAGSLECAVAVAARMGVKAAIIGPHQLTRLAEFDGLWIRAHTAPNGNAYRFARMAERLGLPVLDDSAAIRVCGNKAYQALRLARHGVAQPGTLLIGPGTPLAATAAELGFPLVLKQPDGSFSRAVARAENMAQLELQAQSMFCRSHLLVAQRYVPTQFDWRIGVLGGEALFACRYHMAPGHWQILKHHDGGAADEGPFDAVALPDVPPEVLDIAVRASLAMGGGLHGVDLKESSGGPLVIEVNDNPDMKHGIEDLAEGDRPWEAVIAWFAGRMPQPD